MCDYHDILQVGNIKTFLPSLDLDVNIWRLYGALPIVLSLMILACFHQTLDKWIYYHVLHCDTNDSLKFATYLQLLERYNEQSRVNILCLVVVHHTFQLATLDEITANPFVITVLCVFVPLGYMTPNGKFAWLSHFFLHGIVSLRLLSTNMPVGLQMSRFFLALVWHEFTIKSPSCLLMSAALLILEWSLFGASLYAVGAATLAWIILVICRRYCFNPMHRLSSAETCLGMYTILHNILQDVELAAPHKEQLRKVKDMALSLCPTGSVADAAPSPHAKESSVKSSTCFGAGTGGGIVIDPTGLDNPAEFEGDVLKDLFQFVSYPLGQRGEQREPEPPSNGMTSEDRLEECSIMPLEDGMEASNLMDSPGFQCDEVGSDSRRCSPSDVTSCTSTLSEEVCRNLVAMSFEPAMIIHPKTGTFSWANTPFNSLAAQVGDDDIIKGASRLQTALEIGFGKDPKIRTTTISIQNVMHTIWYRTIELKQGNKSKVLVTLHVLKGSETKSSTFPNSMQHSNIIPSWPVPVIQVNSSYQQTHVDTFLQDKVKSNSGMSPYARVSDPAHNGRPHFLWQKYGEKRLQKYVTAQGRPVGGDVIRKYYKCYHPECQAKLRVDTLKKPSSAAGYPPCVGMELTGRHGHEVNIVHSEKIAPHDY